MLRGLNILQLAAIIVHVWSINVSFMWPITFPNVKITLWHIKHLWQTELLRWVRLESMLYIYGSYQNRLPITFNIIQQRLCQLYTHILDMQFWLFHLLYKQCYNKVTMVVKCTQEMQHISHIKQLPSVDNNGIVSRETQVHVQTNNCSLV